MEGVQFHYPFLDMILKCGLLGYSGTGVDLQSTAKCGHFIVGDGWAGPSGAAAITEIATGDRIFLGNYNSTIGVDSFGVLYMSAAETLALVNHVNANVVVESAILIARHLTASVVWKPVLTHAGIGPKQTLAAEAMSLVASDLSKAKISNTKPDGLPVYNEFWQQCWLAGLQGYSTTRFNASHTVKCLLLNTDHVFDPTMTEVGDIDSGELVTTVANAKTLSGWTVSSGVVDSTTNPQFIGGSDFNTGNGTAGKALIYLSGLSGSPTTMLVACLPIARMNQNGADMTVEWSSSGLFTVSAVA